MAACLHDGTVQKRPKSSAKGGLLRKSNNLYVKKRKGFSGEKRHDQRRSRVKRKSSLTGRKSGRTGNLKDERKEDELLNRTSQITRLESPKRRPELIVTLHLPSNISQRTRYDYWYRKHYAFPCLPGLAPILSRVIFLHVCLPIGWEKSL